uniref:TIL domain-containing protein n=1 Tax=Amblyomma maculatum TaxID=34609 RepID=G3MS39_AMBMU
MTKVTTACILVVLALCAVVLLASAQASSQALAAPYGVSGYPNPYWRPTRPRCRGRNEVFMYCQSSNCGEFSCSILFRWVYSPRICNTDCVNRCFCKPGYYRNFKERCVTPQRCRKPVFAPLPTPRHPPGGRPE